MPDVVTHLKAIQQKIRLAEHQYDRTPGSVSLLAVSKTHPPILISKLVQEKQLAFGENYVQEALIKISALYEKHLEWHFIGRFQSNKAVEIAQNFNWVHTVSRVKDAKLLSQHRPLNLPPMNICIQVKLDNSDTKSGIKVVDVPALVEKIRRLPQIRLRGLMTIPPFAQTFDEQRFYFSQLRNLLAQLNATDASLDTLSMGMTHDLEAAISEGATIVRIGTGIFGPRGNMT